MLPHNSWIPDAAFAFQLARVRISGFSMAHETFRTVKSLLGTWAFLIALLLFSVAAVGFPIFIIRPFAHQAAAALNLALSVQRWAPWFTLIAFLAGIVVIVRAWAGRGKRLRIVQYAFLLAAAAGLGFCAWASRINLYERMFQPAGDARFVPVAQASLRPDDMVIVVSINGADRAYPVRQMAYHHVFNDVVGGVPIVSTY